MERLVGIDAEKLSDDLDSENLRVGELRSGAALTQGFPIFEQVIHQAEDGNDEGALRSIREDLRYVSMVLLSQHRG
jgi:hypothetical protein